MKMMIAEDDDHTREALREVLTMDGFDVVPAADGQQAYDFLRDQRPDFVCLDVMMPGLNGYEVCKRIRRLDAKVLRLLFERKGKVEYRNTLAEEVWGEYFPESWALDQHISQLRKRVEADTARPRIIRMVHGAGYRVDG